MNTSLCCNVAGFKSASCSAGIKKSKGSAGDFGIIAADNPVPAAGVFSKNSAAAAPVKISRLHLEKSRRIRAVLINSGNANACTGEQGRKNCLRLGYEASSMLNAEETEILHASTGVIGHQLPVDSMLDALPGLINSLDTSGGYNLARTIMTTDIVPKWNTVQGYLGGKRITVSGIAKGSGMIAPCMATMLSFILTDAVVSAEVLRRLLPDIAARTFNRVTVDSDTSTNDTAVIMASGNAGNPEISSENDPEYIHLRDLLYIAVHPLAKAIARDGEGATKLITVEAKGFGDDRACMTIARAIAESPLVKTAMFGCDPNWGRIIAAAGKTDVLFSPEDVSIFVSGNPVLLTGEPVPFDRDRLQSSLQSREVYISIQGSAQGGYASMYTCDYSYDYIKINAEYHT